MDPGRIKGIPCCALVVCAAHLLRPLYFKILDPPLYYLSYFRSNILSISNCLHDKCSVFWTLNSDLNVNVWLNFAMVVYTAKTSC